MARKRLYEVVVERTIRQQAKAAVEDYSEAAAGRNALIYILEDYQEFEWETVTRRKDVDAKIISVRPVDK